MKAANEEHIISLEKAENYEDRFKERIALLWFCGFEVGPFSEKFWKYFYWNATAWFNSKIIFPWFSFKTGVMAFVVNKSKSLPKS